MKAYLMFMLIGYLLSMAILIFRITENKYPRVKFYKRSFDYLNLYVSLILLSWTLWLLIH